MKCHRLLQKPCLSALLLVLLAACESPSRGEGREFQGGKGVRNLAAATFDGGLDTTPPDTLIDTYPAPRTRETIALFHYTSTEGVARFECKLSGRDPDFRTCDPAITYSGLTEGTYTFRVRAVDASGNVDPTPAEYTWTVDLTPPVLTLNVATTNGSTASFEFSSNEPASFECRLDGEDYSPCGSPNSQRVVKSYSGLSDGEHAFYLSATDAAGNTGTPDPNPHRWRVDTSPDTTLSSTPPPVTRVPSFTFSFSSSALHAEFQCKFDAEEFTFCSNPKLYNNLSDGQHLFAVRAVDTNGIVDSSPASCSWWVDTTAPDTLLDLTPASLTVTEQAG